MSVGESVARSLRGRELAGDARAGAWGRQKVWREQTAFIKMRWRRLLGGWLLLASPPLLVWWFVPPVVQGVVLGGCLVLATTAVWSLVVSSTGTWSRSMGNQAEQWTAQELRGLRKSGWRLVNGLDLAGDGDTDHVMVGPAGIVVLETKWSARPWLEPNLVTSTATARRQVRRNAVRVRGWSRRWSRGMPVHAVVVLWGGGLHGAADLVTVEVDGVTVLAGRRLREWLRGLPVSPDFGPALVTSVYEPIAAHVKRRDVHLQMQTKAMPTPQELFERSGVFIAVAVLTLIALAQVAEFLGLGWGFAAGLFVWALSLCLWRWCAARGVLRAAAAGLLVGTGLPVAAAALALGISALLQVG